MRAKVEMRMMMLPFIIIGFATKVGHSSETCNFSGGFLGEEGEK